MLATISRMALSMNRTSSAAASLAARNRVSRCGRGRGLPSDDETEQQGSRRGGGGTAAHLWHHLVHAFSALSQSLPLPSTPALDDVSGAAPSAIP